MVKDQGGEITQGAKGEVKQGDTYLEDWPKGQRRSYGEKRRHEKGREKRGQQHSYLGRSGFKDKRTGSNSAEKLRIYPRPLTVEKQGPGRLTGVRAHKLFLPMITHINGS